MGRNANSAMACIVVMGVTLLSGCDGSKNAARTAGDANSTATAAEHVRGATLAGAGEYLSGDDPTALRAYLQSVKDVKPTHFDVEWNPNMVAVSKEAALRSLLKVSEDGSDFTFSASESAIRALKAGSILWIWNIAVRRVVEIETVGETVVVHTQPAALTDAFRRANIEFDAPVDFRNHYLGASTAPEARTASAVTPRTRSQDAARFAATGYEGMRFMRVALPITAPGEKPVNPTTDAEESAGDSAAEDDSADGGTPLHDAYVGKIKDLVYSIGYQTRENGITLTLEARRGGDLEDEQAKDTRANTKRAIGQALKNAAAAKAAVEEARQSQRAERQQLDALNKNYEQTSEDIQASKAAAKDPTAVGASLLQLQQIYANKRKTILDTLQTMQSTLYDAEKRLRDARAQMKALAQAGAWGKKLFDIAADNLDVRFRARTDLDNLSVSGSMHISDGQMDSAAAKFNNMNGKVAVSIIGRLGHPGDGRIKLPLVNIPVVFNIPIPIGGLPFVIQLGTDFNLSVLLAGNNATMQFDGTFAFSGNGGFHATKAGAQPDQSIAADEPGIDNFKTTTPGDSTLILGFQAPRVGFGIGMLGVSTVAYIDWVHVIAISSGSSFAMSFVAPPCKKVTYEAISKVGIDTRISALPVPFLDDVVNKTLSPSKEIFHKTKTVNLVPLPACGD